MHRMNTYRGTNRAESLMEFIDKTHKIRKEKYCYYIQKGNLLKIQDKNENNLGLEELDYYKNSTSYELFKLFDNNRQLYQKYLVKEIDKESDKNEKLHERKLKILNEMQRIKKKINKLRSIIELNYKDKFFLLCVKNGTNVIDKFCHADRKECLNSISSIQNITSIKVLSSTEKSQSKFISAKRLLQILESDIILFTEQKKVEKPYVIFKTVDEFKKCLNNISFNVAKLLIKFNQVQNEVTSLRQTMEERRKEIEKDQKMNLNNLKSKNRDLLEYYYNIPKENINNPLLKQKILKVFNNINSLFPISSNKKITYNITEFSYLQDIEIGFTKLNKLMLFYKETCPKRFGKVKDKRDKENKMEMLHHLKMKERKKFILKIENIVTKQHKAIMKII